MLVALMQARRVLEIGTFTGYSALSMAEALPPDGELITCDRDPEVARIARSFFDRSEHGAKIRIALGDALATLRAMPASPAFDLVFIDADKERYPAYYEEALARRGGPIVADNTLWSGEVLAPESADGRAIARLQRSRLPRSPGREGHAHRARRGDARAQALKAGARGRAAARGERRRRVRNPGRIPGARR